ncbi:MAG: nucleoid-associated protein, partial [Phaeodactylibacter sp.]|nr:nucleoid-associated protein [Phaeodactylibacter sp.]
MIDFSTCRIDQVAVHRVGNKHRAEKNFRSEALLPLQDELLEALQNFLLKPFRKPQDWYQFQHSSDLQLNEVYTYAATIFEAPDRLLEQSGHILQHLYNQSEHPNIKSGEVYVVHFQDLLLGDELLDGVGIFKSEQKHRFLKVHESGTQLILDPETGIHLDKLDKGCLILNTEAADGYRLLSVDQNN